MCKGAEEIRKQGGGNHRSFIHLGQNPLCCTRRVPVSCELCCSPASFYCQADDAYLCEKCDRWVHSANFLALRHIRCFLCSTCQNLTRRFLVGVSADSSGHSDHLETWKHAKEQ